MVYHTCNHLSLQYSHCYALILILRIEILILKQRLGHHFPSFRTVYFLPIIINSDDIFTYYFPIIRNVRIERLDKSFQQQEYDSKPLIIVLGSLLHK
jgi:hypothetical protein